ncbi:MAG TPA: SRPBCC domain-containing protein, partial [Anaerolineales bacterium]|nr:SRPBCC domain-containing protein [Anaerolineales bacterium]
MIIEGDFTVDAPIQQVWDFLVDIQRMSLCLPGVEQVEQTVENTYSGIVTVKVGPIATSFQGEVNILEQDAPRLLRARLRGKDRKTASMVSGEFSSE